MNRDEYLLTCLAEECAEIQQRVSKALRFGLNEVQPGQGKTNKERLHDEVLDFLGVLDMLEQTALFPPPNHDVIRAAVAAKREKIEKFYTYSRFECGTIHDP